MERNIENAGSVEMLCEKYVTKILLEINFIEKKMHKTQTH